MWQTLSEHFYERTVWGNLWMCSHLVQPAWWNLGILHFLLLYLHGRNYMNVHDIIYFLSSQTITSFLVFVTIHIIDGACVKMLCKTLLLVVRIYLWCKCCVNGLKKNQEHNSKKNNQEKKRKRKQKRIKKRDQWKQNENKMKQKKNQKKKKKIKNKKKKLFRMQSHRVMVKRLQMGVGRGPSRCTSPSPPSNRDDCPPPLKNV